MSDVATSPHLTRYFDYLAKTFESCVIAPKKPSPGLSILAARAIVGAFVVTQ